MIPGTTHPMFEQAPQQFCEIVLDFLAGMNWTARSGRGPLDCRYHRAYFLNTEFRIPIGRAGMIPLIRSPI